MGFRHPAAPGKPRCLSWAAIGERESAPRRNRLAAMWIAARLCDIIRPEIPRNLTCKLK